jgi:hypothetical protein
MARTCTDSVLDPRHGAIAKIDDPRAIAIVLTPDSSIVTMNRDDAGTTLPER